MEKFLYNDISIDFDSRLICQNGLELALDPKAFNTLALLIQNKDRVVSNDELIERIWASRPTSNDVVTASIGRVRKLFKQAGIKSEVIRTAHKVGYQFVLEQMNQETPLAKAAVDQPPTHTNRLRFHIALNVALFTGLLLVGTFLASHYLPTELGSTDIPDDHQLLKINQQEALASRTKIKPTEIFFIRHAEKESDGTDDPPLSALGITRAGRWRTFFDDINFDEIYTTKFIRNTQTVDHVFGKSADNVKYYSALSFDISVELGRVFGKKIAIIGHSNTIPGMVNRLVTDRQYDAMDFRNYELIYQVTIDSSGGVTSNQFKLDYILEE